MSRYIDADALIEFIAKGLNNPDKTKAFGYDAIEILTEIEYAPTADVVPKSEVEELICKLECLLCHVTGGRLSKHTYDLATMETVATDCINETYNDGYGEGYKDCATEIFAEIEKKSCVISETNHSTGSTRVVCHQISAEKLAELKKKYTEENV